MAKLREVFVCRTCGAVQSRWMGKCPDCGAWDSLESERVEKSAGKDPQRGVVEAWRASGADVTELMVEAKGGAGGGAAGAPVAVPIAQATGDESPARRLVTGIGELDRVLGGGLVPGSVVLIGGDPGIGKSTLMLQAAGLMGAGTNRGPGPGSRVSGNGSTSPPSTRNPEPETPNPPSTSDIARILYVSSEESAEQVRMRAARLGAAAAPGLFVLADTNLARIVEQTRKVAPAVLVIDSVQMIYKADLDAAPGSVAQLRRCAAELVYLAKLSGIAVVLVGHVTKEGRLAGPRLLEHLVDAVLYFEGDRYHAHRILRGVKNRFGTTLEIGIFEMTGSGLKEVPGGLGVGALDGDSSSREAKVGAVVCPVMTGTRCVLVELQALTATGFIGAAKRKSSGLDSNRLAMLIAVLEQHAGLRLADRDVFASSVGGLRIAEPAADLSLLLAIAGAHHKRAVAPGTAAAGEVGLGGEVRAVTQLEQRLREAGRLGFSRVLVPASQKGVKAKGVETVPVKTISQAIEELG
ncbi:MAG: DNA repair protein RadA [Phycisphaeraceae bacterium]|nr:DNA repair protein RadA [Phycisphaeraceae bacterium]